MIKTLGWCEVSKRLIKLQTAWLLLHKNMISWLRLFFLGFDSSCGVPLLWKTSWWLLLLLWYHLIDKIVSYFLAWPTVKFFSTTTKYQIETDQGTLPHLGLSFCGSSLRLTVECLDCQEFFLCSEGIPCVFHAFY